MFAFSTLLGSQAVGAYLKDDGFTDTGAFFMLYLSSNGGVKSHTKISATAGGFTGELLGSDWFGIQTSSAGLSLSLYTDERVFSLHIQRNC